MIDLSGDFGERVRRRLREEQVIWLTTIGPDLTPQPRPIWFLWKDEKLLTYSRPGAYKLKHIERYPNVALHFNSNPRGRDVVVMLGKAEVLTDFPPATEVDGYIEKYRASIAGQGSTPGGFSRDFSTAIEVEPFKLRGL